MPKFREDVKDIADLKDGMELEGTVTNVTNFGAFVDLGVHQDGLVHISELSHKYVQDARQAVKVGDIVKVKVIGVDSEMKRISLSMKAVMPKPAARPREEKQDQAPRAAAQAAAPGRRDGTGAPAAGPDSGRKHRARQRPPRKPDRRRSQRSCGRPKPVCRNGAPPPKQTMEEKIRLLQEKFGRAR